MAVEAIAPTLAERRRALLAALGEPQRALRVVHVAGTNGKGSTVAMLAEVLKAAGYTVGRFTSPDLQGPHERVWVDGEPLTPEGLAEWEARLAPHFEAIAAQYPTLPEWRPFERWCAIAWCYFQAREVEIAVVEAGLGGRDDATSVFETPELTLVSAVDRDHAAFLGPDLTAIAAHKAGIFRPGVPALSSARGTALAVLRREAGRVAAPFERVLPLSARPHPEGGWWLDTPTGPLALSLGGPYQPENAALALRALELLNQRGWTIPPEALSAGLSSVRWPGRFERVWDPHGGQWLLDGAHNPAAVRALVSGWGDPAIVVAGFQRAKEAQPMVEALSRNGRPIVVVPLPDGESWDAETVAGFSAGPVYAAADLATGLVMARQLAPDAARCLTGSIYLVGAARAALLQGAS